MSEKPTRGHPNSLTDAVQKAIVTSISCGSSLAVAARAAGINPMTAMEWIRRGEDRDDKPFAPRYAAFAQAVAQAKAKAQDHAIRVVRQAMAKDWRAATWYLEKTCNRFRFAPRTKIELTGKDGGPLEVRAPTIFIPQESDD